MVLLPFFLVTPQRIPKVCSSLMSPLGLETAGCIMTALIECNTTVPMEKPEIFSTYLVNQPLSSSARIKNNHLIVNSNSPESLPLVTTITYGVDKLFGERNKI